MCWAALGICTEYPIMRIRHVLLGAAVSVSFALMLSPQVKAQSLFQKLFGIGGAPANQPLPQSRVQIPAYRFLRSNGGSHINRSQPRSQSQTSDEIGPPDRGGPYRTMCVRACDGFYFPLRHQAQHKNFAPDVKSCRSACGDDAKLFYYPEETGSPDTMVDLADRKYSETVHAFAYRKALVDGCACKPAPWAPEEVARHQGYVFAEAAAKAREAIMAPADNSQSTDTVQGAVAVAAAKAPESASTVATDAPVEKAQEPETYEPVRTPVQKTSSRRKPLRQPRERDYVTGFRPISSPAAVQISPKRYIWRGHVR